jgi:glycosyltransferase involved in cell wall biosynthesis
MSTLNTKNNDPRPVIGIDASRANVEQKTGIEWYAYHLIMELKQLIPDSYRVELYTRESLRDGLEDLPDHWTERVLRWPPKYLWTQVRLAWEMVVRPPDLLFVPAHTMPLVLPKKSATTLHDVTFMVIPDAYSWKGRTYHKFAADYAVKHADQIFTVSGFSKSEIVKWFGADDEKISVTPISYDADSFRSDLDHIDTLRVLDGLRIRKPYFLFVGRLQRKKNLDALVRGFRKFREKHGDWRLVLVGKRGRGAEEALAGDTEGIIEVGYTSSEELPYVYSGAEAFVFPARHEGFGIPVLEAFASGTPVICSTETSLPEVAGPAAYFLETNDISGIASAMERVASDEELRGDLRRLGLERVKEFSWKRTAEETWKGLEKALMS